MRISATFAALLALGVSALAMPPVPRKAPEFTIVEPSGKQTLLSSYKGKVVCIEFLYTTCPHCQETSKVFSKLQRELGPQGVQFIGVAFNDNAALLTDGFVKQFGVAYPVGYSNIDTVLSYLGISVMDRWMVPQIVVIDRKGMIRAQSPPTGDVNLQTEVPLKLLLEGLIKESVPTSNNSKKAPAAPKKAS
jgi:peroxiredoxin